MQSIEFHVCAINFLLNQFALRKQSCKKLKAKRLPVKVIPGVMTDENTLGTKLSSS